jgi:hypothetical protein
MAGGMLKCRYIMTRTPRCGSARFPVTLPRNSRKTGSFFALAPNRVKGDLTILLCCIIPTMSR